MTLLQRILSLSTILAMPHLIDASLASKGGRALKRQQFVQTTEGIVSKLDQEFNAALEDMAQEKADAQARAEALIKTHRTSSPDLQQKYDAVQTILSKSASITEKKEALKLLPTQLQNLLDPKASAKPTAPIVVVMKEEKKEAKKLSLEVTNLQKFVSALNKKTTLKEIAKALNGVLEFIKKNKTQLNDLDNELANIDFWYHYENFYKENVVGSTQKRTGVKYQLSVGSWFTKNPTEAKKIFEDAKTSIYKDMTDFKEEIDNLPANLKKLDEAMQKFKRETMDPLKKEINDEFEVQNMPEQKIV